MHAAVLLSALVPLEGTALLGKAHNEHGHKNKRIKEHERIEDQAGQHIVLNAMVPVNGCSWLHRY